MAGRIPQSFIDDLLSRIDIVEVIDAHVPLKKAGRDYAACCPFHDEKTPSFTVSPTKQFFHCFGCGAHGTALGFLMEYDHLGFVEAVEELAERLGLEVPHEGGAPAAGAGRDLKPLYELLGQADRYFRHQLRHHPAAAKAVDYLKGRGVSGEVAAAFGLGYAPPGWDGLLQALGRDDGAVKHLVEVGLLIEREEDRRRYDRFRDRVIFPIRDPRGRTVGFGGRVLGEDDAQGSANAAGGRKPGAAKPKYLNSPESEVFHKGRELYGLYEAQQALRRPERLLVVEGYMDVVALAQHGIAYAVATLGTAATADHLQRLFRVTAEVVFCFDGDEAGGKAAWRALENALPLMRDGRQVRFMFLPQGEDPDSLVRTIGGEAFAARLAEAAPLSDFLFDHLRRQCDPASEEGRARLVELGRPLVSKLPTGAFRELITQRLAREARMDEGALRGLLGERAAAPTSAPAARPKRLEPVRNAPSPVRHAITLLLQYPALAAEAGDPEQLDELQMPGAALLAEMVALLREHPHLNTAALLEHWRDTDAGRHLARLAIRELGLAGEEEVQAEFRDTLALLQHKERARRRQERLEVLQSRPFRELTADERNELKRLLDESAYRDFT